MYAITLDFNNVFRASHVVLKTIQHLNAGYKKRTVNESPIHDTRYVMEYALYFAINDFIHANIPFKKNFLLSNVRVVALDILNSLAVTLI